MGDDVLEAIRVQVVAVGRWRGFGKSSRSSFLEDIYGGDKMATVRVSSI